MRPSRAADDAPHVSVIGILTYTRSPQPAIRAAWRSISPKSSAITSNEIGRPSEQARAWRAKRS